MAGKEEEVVAAGRRRRRIVEVEVKVAGFFFFERHEKSRPSAPPPLQFKESIDVLAPKLTDRARHHDIGQRAGGVAEGHRDQRRRERGTNDRAPMPLERTREQKVKNNGLRGKKKKKKKKHSPSFQIDPFLSSIV